MLWSSTSAQQTAKADTVAIQLLAFNDFHGNLEPPSGSNGLVGSVEAGGAEYFATHLATLAARNPNTLIVSAGDMIGASPLLSGMFHDEPSIEALNAMGLDVAERRQPRIRQRMARAPAHAEWWLPPRRWMSGQHAICRGGISVSRRERARSTQETPDRTGPVLPPYAIKEVGGVRIGFIGLALKANASAGDAGGRGGAEV